MHINIQTKKSALKWTKIHNYLFDKLKSTNRARTKDQNAADNEINGSKYKEKQYE